MLPYLICRERGLLDASEFYRRLAGKVSWRRHQKQSASAALSAFTLSYAKSLACHFDYSDEPLITVAMQAPREIIEMSLMMRY